MRHTLPMLLAVLLSAGAIVYALLAVANNLRQVSDDLEVVTHDMAGISDDVRSLADDVNAIADVLAGEEEDDQTRQSPAAVAAASPHVRRSPTTLVHLDGHARHARVHRAAVRGPLASQAGR